MRKREGERVRTGKQAGGFTLFIIKVHKQTKNLHVQSFYGLYWKKKSAFCSTLLDFPQPHILPFKWINVCYSEPLFIGKIYFECISKNTNKF